MLLTWIFGAVLGLAAVALTAYIIGFANGVDHAEWLAIERERHRHEQ